MSGNGLTHWQLSHMPRPGFRQLAVRSLRLHDHQGRPIHGSVKYIFHCSDLYLLLDFEVLIPEADHRLRKGGRQNQASL